MISAVLLSIAMLALGSAISATPAGNTDSEGLHSCLSLDETCQKIAASTSAASESGVHDVGFPLNSTYILMLLSWP
jgi:hypothetical protein